MSERPDRGLRFNELFVRFLLIVLSIAVLVLDRSLRYRFESSDQSSQNRNDPIQIGLPNPI